MRYGIGFLDKRTGVVMPQPHYGEHATNFAAKKAYVDMWNPQGCDHWPDSQFRTCFDLEARSEKRIKVIKL